MKSPQVKVQKFSTIDSDPPQIRGKPLLWNFPSRRKIGSFYRTTMYFFPPNLWREKRRKILGKMKEFDLICALAVWGEAGATRGGGGLDDNNLLQDEG